MKRIIAVIIIVTLLLTGCDTAFTGSGTEVTKSGLKSGKTASGVWLSYSEINSMMSSENGFKSEFSTLLSNCESLGVDNIYIHIRPFCDSLYKSDYFPLQNCVKNTDYDVFGYMISELHAKNIKVHAWVNPYRVLTSSSSVEDLRSDSPAFTWLYDNDSDNDKNICFTDNGIYLNPASYEVRELVINGIRETVTKYAVDGIHFDDYFYPTTDPAFDEASYTEYKENTVKPLSLECWRRANTDLLISSCYTAIKHLKKDVIFSISPAASLEKNYSELYADVEKWVKEGYADCIIPQLYFGYEYPEKDFCFDTLLENWKKIMCRHPNVSFFVGLASYKTGTDTYPDCTEWQNSGDIIARQAKSCIGDPYVDGYVFFSYSSLFSDSSLNKKQLENYKKVTKK